MKLAYNTYKNRLEITHQNHNRTDEVIAVRPSLGIDKEALKAHRAALHARRAEIPTGKPGARAARKEWATAFLASL